VIATDQHYNASTQVTVNVLDVNDNPPQFTQSQLSVRTSASLVHAYTYVGSYRVTIPEDTPVGHNILNVTATDRDIYPNNFICYRLLNQVS